MKIAGRTRPSGRKAIAPIIATVLVIASTLILSVAVGGMVYGTIGSSANTARVEVTGTNVPAAVALGVTYVVCASASGNSYAGYIQLYNSGTAATVASAFTITYAGSVVEVALGGSCKIAPESSLYLVIYSLPTFVNSGVAYTGYVSTGNGAEVLFASAFN